MRADEDRGLPAPWRTPPRANALLDTIHGRPRRHPSEPPPAAIDSAGLDNLGGVDDPPCSVALIVLVLREFWEDLSDAARVAVVLALCVVLGCLVGAGVAVVHMAVDRCASLPAAPVRAAVQPLT